METWYTAGVGCVDTMAILCSSNVHTNIGGAGFVARRAAEIRKFQIRQPVLQLCAIEH